MKTFDKLMEIKEGCEKCGKWVSPNNTLCTDCRLDKHNTELDKKKPIKEASDLASLIDASVDALVTGLETRIAQEVEDIMETSPVSDEDEVREKLEQALMQKIRNLKWNF